MLESRPGRPPVAGTALLLVLLLPGLLLGQEDEERRYGPAEVLGCDVVFAVFASTTGEPAAVRRCPRSGGRDLSFAPEPIVDLTHVDSVAVAAADSGHRQVVARLTEEGLRRIRRFADSGRPLEVGVVLDGEVVARFTSRISEASPRITVLTRVSPGRAERVVARLRAAVDRAGGGGVVEDPAGPSVDGVELPGSMGEGGFGRGEDPAEFPNPGARSASSPAPVRPARPSQRVGRALPVPDPPARCRGVDGGA